MPLKRKGTSPFRGPTPKKVFQTVDVGSGRADYILRQARKSPDRKYAAIDPAYKPPTNPIEFRNPATSAIQKAKIRMAELGATVHEGTILTFVDKMIHNRYKTRNINIDMPNPFEIKEELPGAYHFEKLFKKIPQILIPKGTIFISTEVPSAMDFFKGLAQKHGLKFQNLIPITHKKALKKTETTRMFAKVFRAKIIFEPRKYKP